MRGRFFIAMCAAVALASQAPMPVVAQTDTEHWTLSRTPWGDPDMQGIWSFATITPLERPPDAGVRGELTDTEVAQLNLDARTRSDRAPRAGSTGTYNAFWWDWGESIGRSSLIIDPPDGRIPPLTEKGQARVHARDDARMRRSDPRSGRTDRSRNAASSIVPCHGGDRPHIDPKIRLWNGDSRGHWEGDTLVVETTNFSDKTSFRGSGANLHLIERFTRTGPDRVVWEFTVEDATIWTRPWTGGIPFRRVEGPVFEYACHEGNYAMATMLRGSRANEQAATVANPEGR